MTPDQQFIAIVVGGYLVFRVLFLAVCISSAGKRIRRLEAELHQHTRNRGVHANVYTGRYNHPQGGQQ